MRGSVGRFTSADTDVPASQGVQAFDRYAFVNNNPVRYTDPSGHFAIPAAVILGIVIVLKVIDYGWTAYDAGSALITAANPNNLPDVRKDALTTAAVAVGMELIEPDELSPVGLPIDDIVRHGDDIVSQVHHFASNKHLTKWTEQFQAIASKYGLDLDELWNKGPVPGHSGRHPDSYHQWVLQQMQDISNQLGDCGANCADQFMEMFKERVIDPVLEDPTMLTKKYWE
jgi:hypothetical protein